MMVIFLQPASLSLVATVIKCPRYSVAGSTNTGMASCSSTCAVTLRWNSRLRKLCGRVLKAIMSNFAGAAARKIPLAGCGANTRRWRVSIAKLSASPVHSTEPRAWPGSQVMDLDFVPHATAKTVVRIHYRRDKASQTQAVEPHDVVLMTNGSMTANSTLGSMTSAPDLNASRTDGA